MSTTRAIDVKDQAASETGCADSQTLDPHHLTPLLSAWLAASDIGYLELRGPDTQLCLRNEAGQVKPVAANWLAGVQARVQARSLPVHATSVGIFLHSHPAQSHPLVQAGQAVTAGQVLGLLRIGVLLLPVTAPHAGTVAGYRIASGTTVGYGTALVDLVPTPPV